MNIFKLLVSLLLISFFLTILSVVLKWAIWAIIFGLAALIVVTIIAGLFG